MKLSEMTKDERSLLLYLESRATDQGGTVDARRMNKEDFDIAKRWNEDGFIEFGRVASCDLAIDRTYWVVLTPPAWDLAHQERIARADRMWDKRAWKMTSEV